MSSESQAALEERLSRRDSDQSRLDREHELKMEILKTYQSDPDLFYKLLVVGGAGLTALFSALGITVKELDTSKPVFGTGLQLPGLDSAIFGSMGLTIWAAMLLTIPKVFGEDGIQAKASGGGFGFSADVEVG